MPQKKLSSAIRIFLILAIIAIVIFLLWWFFIRQPPIPHNIIQLSGRIEGDDSTVAAKNSGRIREIRVREGDTVKAGEVIAVLDEVQAAAREEQARSTLQGAETRVTRSQEQIAVLQEQLKQARITTEQARLDAQGRVRQAEAQVASAEANLSQAQAAYEQARYDVEKFTRLARSGDVSDLTVVAPFDGTVATRVAEPGEVVSPGTAIVTMVDLSKIYLRGFVPEGDIGRVKLEQPARIYLDSNPKATVDAVVSRIDPESSFTPENTYFRDERVKQVVGVKLLIKNPTGAAKPGMPADGEILVEGTTWPKDTGRR